MSRKRFPRSPIRWWPIRWRDVGVVYRKELTDSLRDRRTVISMVAVPLLLIPVLTLIIGVVSARLIGRAMQEIPEVMVVGGEDSPKVLAELKAFKEIAIVPASADYAQRIARKQLRAAVRIPGDFDAELERGGTATVDIYMYEGELKSGFGADRLQTFFRDLRDRQIRARLASRGLPASVADPIRVEQKNIAQAQQVGGAERWIST